MSAPRTLLLCLNRGVKKVPSLPHHNSNSSPYTPCQWVVLYEETKEEPESVERERKGNMFRATVKRISKKRQEKQ